MSFPLVTIVITNYNHARYLPKAFESLLKQTYPQVEILVVDDGSTDNSVEVTKRYKEVRLIEHEKNQGVAAALNTGLFEAKGEYVHTMGADDLRMPDFLEKTMRPLIENNEIGLACSDFGYVKGETNEGEVRTDRLLKGVSETQVFGKKEIVRVFQTTHFWIPGHTAVYKRELALKYGGFKEELKFYCDWYLLHQIALDSGALYVPKTLSVWWIYEASYSGELVENLGEKRRVYRSLLQDLKTKKPMQKAFMRSTLLRLPCKCLLRELFYRPRYWGFFLYLARKSLYLRMKGAL
ncbi:MAG: hypothetical protein SP1CHLAM54_15380 [Chlamydiia bacterium]|nr:hypothetical protein [Chlamydiia bacterium]MCH9616428.1 hypothetical protein [Chlamydiia bacterium]MCH9629586.1 hypothetical protein [Chlamydiia bacterium]